MIFARAKSFNQGNSVETLPQRMLHPVSITRFPLRRLSPGAGLLRNPFVTLSMLRFSRGWVRKDGNLLTETGCTNWLGHGHWHGYEWRSSVEETYWYVYYKYYYYY